MRATVVSFTPVAHGRLAVDASSAAVEGGEMNILWLFLCRCGAPERRQGPVTRTSVRGGDAYLTTRHGGPPASLSSCMSSQAEASLTVGGARGSSLIIGRQVEEG